MKRLKQILVTNLIALAVVISFNPTLGAQANSYNGSSFQEVWDQVESDPYQTLPHDQISFFSTLGFLKSRIQQAADRTLSDRSDILPQFRKLAHPNGICLSGHWIITKDNPYSGYFKNGSEALFIARSSVALSATTRGNHRGFGMAGKLFPTLDKNETVESANFFVIDDLGGTLAENYTDVQLTNEPTVSVNSTALKHALYAAKLALAFSMADSNPEIRQLYPISELGEVGDVTTPKWIRISAAKGQERVDEEDFRLELLLHNYAYNQLVFNIEVSSPDKAFEKIGLIIFNRSIISNSCDHRLHFHHPPSK